MSRDEPRVVDFEESWDLPFGNRSCQVCVDGLHFHPAFSRETGLAIS